ncbi:thymocyte nuclear protein 1-like [Babylonia areolata]|uniref:thymocyte nuclear protein 1-like n=1 Tax=Babylonia areolata TaxID=304850 RepID=UPI003FD37652
MPSRKKRKTTDGTSSEPPAKKSKQSTAAKSGSSSERSSQPHGKGKTAASSAPKGDKPVYTHWLIKSEPESRFENGIDMKFSFGDLKNCPNQTEHWDGVRNYQARNFLRDDMKEGHKAFFYHSNCKEPGIIGTCTVVKSGYPDHTQFDKSDPHYDSSSKRDNPKWYMVDVKYGAPLPRFVSLSELKRLHQEHAGKGGPLRNMALFTRARLSVQPVSQEEWDFIVELSKTDG